MIPRLHRGAGHTPRARFKPGSVPRSRLIAWTATATFFAATLVLIVFTLAQVPRAATRVPWQDEWAMLEEYAAIAKGSSLFQMLWSPYWAIASSSRA